MKTIFLDNNATTPVRADVLDAILPYFNAEFANASSIYQMGQRTRKAIEDARADLASFIGAEDPDEIIFTSGGTESNNLAIRGVLEANPGKGRRMVSSAIEHSSVRTVLRHLAEENRIDHVVAPVQPNGVLNPKEVADAITDDTVLVSIMAVNNEIGTIQPVSEIAQICRKKGVLFHTDAVQMAGKMKIDVNELGVDLLSLSGHKFGAPKGSGILYVRKGSRLRALFEGGRQEKNRRAGTENVPAIVGIGKAAQIEIFSWQEENARLRQLRDRLEQNLLAGLTYVSINGDKEKRVSNTSNLCFEYVENSALIMALDLKGVACSSGSACIAGSADPSHVLLALGLPRHKAQASVRLSLGYTTTESDIETASGIIIETVNRLRETHPLWKQAANQ